MSGDAMATTAFGVIYEGPALESGEIPVAHLAPSLLALAEVFNRASAIAYPERKPASLYIRGSREGSFAVDLVLAPGGLWDQVRDIFSGDDATALANLFGIVFGGTAAGTGLFKLVQKLRGRTPEITYQDDKIARLVIDGEEIDIDPKVLEIYQNLEIRKQSREFVEPLTSKGIDAVRVFREDDTTIKLDRGDVAAFDVPDTPLESFEEQIVSEVLEISHVAFDPGHKWRFTDGQSTFHAKIEDPGFADSVDRGVESFRSGDMLRCKVALRQTRRTTGLYTERAIVEVLEHIRADVQLPLPSTQPE